MDDSNVTAKPPRRFRRLLRWVATLAILFILMLASMPTLLSTSPVRRMLVRAINTKLHPGRVSVGGLSFSWTRAVALSDVVLVDPNGKTVFTAESVRSDRGILGLAASRPDYGTILVEGATIDFERREDGSIDVLDAVGGLMQGKPGGEPGPGEPSRGEPGPGGAGASPSVIVVVKGGRVRIASPELVEPIASDAFEAEAKIVPGKPLDFVMTLTEGERTLKLDAKYDLNAAPGASADETLILTGQDWPLAVREAGLNLKGRLVGTIQLDRKAGLWSAQGGAVLHRAVADGPLLAGDRLELERVAADCDVVMTASGWSVRKLELKSPVAELTASGDVPAIDGAPARLNGHVDLAAASKLLPRAIPLRRGIAIDKGRARIKAELSVHDGVDRLVASADVADLAATENGRALTLRDPASLSAVLVRAKGITAVESFALKAAGVDATATGDLTRGVKLSGAVDLAAIEAQARELIDLGAVSLAGKGGVAADYRPGKEIFQARVAAELDGLRIAGLTAEPIARDHVRIDGVSDGPRSASGLPEDWHAARLGVDDGTMKAKVHAKQTAGAPTVFVLEGSMPIASPAPGVAFGRVALHQNGPVYELDEVRLTAKPADPRAASAAVSLVAKGQLDLNAGRLGLIPMGVQPSPGVAIGPQGFLLSGIGKADVAMGVDTVLVGELGALDGVLGYWMQTDPRGMRGEWSGRVTASREEDGRLNFKGWVNSPNLVTSTPWGSITLSTDGSYAPSADQLVLKYYDLTTVYGRSVGGGTIAELGGRRMADVAGSLEPRWDTLDPIVASYVEPRARVRAKVKPFELRGSLAGGSTSQVLKGLQGVLAVDLDSAQAFGVQVGPTPVVLRLAGGKAVFDPIASSVNGGPMAISADLYLEDPNALWLRLGKGTKIEGAAINQVVSEDVLSYIAPVLSKASNIGGKVSLAVDGAAIPLIGDGALRVDGQLVFQDVVFQPGPFASEVVSLTGRATPKMTLQQPLQLQIADGRVKQSGFTIPLANDLKAEIAGSIGFDRTLALRASLPVTPRMLGNSAVVQEFAGGTNITVPIGGTISRPIIDRAGLRVALKDAARSMLKRGARAEADRLLERVLPPAANGANGNGGSTGNDALKLLEGLGRDLARPRR